MSLMRFRQYAADREPLRESRASDKFENDIAAELNKMGFDASRPKVDSTYSDVLVNHNGKKVWIEVKMNHTDQLGNVRSSFDGKKWSSAIEKKGPLRGKQGPLKIFINKLLDKHAKDFVAKAQKFTGKKKMNTNKGPQQKDPDTINHQEMKDFLATQRNQYIISVPVNNLDQAVRDHYSKGGKTEPAYYLQAGDDFYRLSNEDPLGVASDVPMFKGSGDFKMRVSIRTNMYEIQPELKVSKMDESPYSLKAGTSKKNPFTHSRVRST